MLVMDFIKMLARDKHSNLFYHLDGGEERSFITMIPDVALGAPIAFPLLPFHFSHPVVNVKNIFSSFLTLLANKLESLSVASI